MAKLHDVDPKVKKEIEEALVREGLMPKRRPVDRKPKPKIRDLPAEQQDELVAERILKNIRKAR